MFITCQCSFPNKIPKFSALPCASSGSHALQFWSRQLFLHRSLSKTKRRFFICPTGEVYKFLVIDQFGFLLFQNFKASGLARRFLTRERRQVWGRLPSKHRPLATRLNLNLQSTLCSLEELLGFVDSVQHHQKFNATSQVELHPFSIAAYNFCFDEKVLGQDAVTFHCIFAAVNFSDSVVFKCSVTHRKLFLVQ